MSHQVPVSHHDDQDELIARLDRGEVLETPLTRLRAARFTPQTLMFVRSSNPYPPGKDTLAPVPLTGILQVDGLVRDTFELPLPADRMRHSMCREWPGVLHQRG
ncbi:hypothetical protein [Deinococcus peraridilitoris]|uniref:hypothetical protein n=1 Tax=Deinococcus peraridilitoris TaxID=432329 RepID=UPI0003166335|nr:hypothetical protein [Deinococcus peraridilitoris]